MASYTMPLKDAVELFRREPRSASNSYEWYRRQAHRSGSVWMGDERQLANESTGTKLLVTKLGRGWMVDPDELQARLREHRLAAEELRQLADDLDRNVLHGAPGVTLRTATGSYTRFVDFHAVTYPPRKPRDGFHTRWVCSRCFTPATTEHGKPACHTCSDWGSCGGDCTLSLVRCVGCGTQLPR